jgi:hypothetical protein
MVVRRQGAEGQDAEDLTQGSSLCYWAQDLNTVRKEKGRPFLLPIIKHFLADESRHAMAIKRGKGSAYSVG